MNNKAILLVEDNPNHEALLLRALKQNNFSNEVIVARDGAEAVDYLLGKSYVPLALVLVDLKLPKVDGLKVLRSVRAAPHTRRLPVVILTTSKKEQALTNGHPLGANRYIRKPIDFGQFTESVRQLGLDWQVLNKAAPASMELI
jgi:DNA-binding response OmpR family regulator